MGKTFRGAMALVLCFLPIGLSAGPRPPQTTTQASRCFWEQGLLSFLLGEHVREAVRERRVRRIVDLSLGCTFGRL